MRPRAWLSILLATCNVLTVLAAGHSLYCTQPGQQGWTAALKCRKCVSSAGRQIGSARSTLVNNKMYKLDLMSLAYCLGYFESVVVAVKLIQQDIQQDATPAGVDV
jgi:hypothetical protein